MNVHHHHVHAVLLKYLPGTLAETALDRALSECGLDRVSFERRHLPAVVQKLESSIRLFVDAPSQEKLCAELEALGGRSAQRALSMSLAEEEDVSRARLLMRRVCSDFGMNAVVAQKCVTIVSELTRNVVSYTRGGTIEIEVASDPRRIHIRVRDSGPGIQGMDQILAGTYQSKTGLGKGLRGVKRLARAFNVKTGATGTDIRVDIAW